MRLLLLTLLAVTVQSQAPPAATGILAGQVVDADTGAPVPGAIVRLGPPVRLMDASGSGDYRLTATTFGMRWIEADSEGRFVVRSVGNGEYLLAVNTPGYLLSGYDQQRPNGVLRPIVVSDQTPRHTALTLKAWKLAAITGTIFDDAGEPAVGIDVRALRYDFRSGRVALTAAATAQTDDRGVYRLAGLAPGDYAVLVPAIAVTLPASVAAEHHAAVAAGTPPSRQSAEFGIGYPVRPAGSDLLLVSRPRRPIAPSGAYESTFYPAARSPSDAARIRLASGDERSGIDIRLRLVRTFSISGIVSGREQVPGNVTMALLPEHATQPGAPSALETALTMPASDGRFTFVDVPEGEYQIRVLAFPPPTEAMTPTTFERGGQTTTIISVRPGEVRAPTGPTWWANVPVSVRGADQPDVQVALRPGARISGRIEFRGSAPPPKPQPNSPYYDVELIPADGRLLPGFTAARADAAYAFTTMQYPSGRYFADVNMAPRPWKLRSVTIGGRDVLTTPFDLGESDVTGVVVTFTDRDTVLDGTVRASGTADAGGAIVVLFPADVGAWMANGMNRRLFRRVAASSDGAFSLTDLLPGEYLVAALPADTPDDPADPQTIKRLAPEATPVTLAEGERRSVVIDIARLR